MSSRENHVIARKKSREIGHHQKIRSSRGKNLAKSCHHEILDSLYNMLIPNDRSSSVAAKAATATAVVTACGRCRLDAGLAGLPRHSSHCHIPTAVAIAARSCLVLRSQTTTTTLYNILDRWYIWSVS